MLMSMLSLKSGQPLSGLTEDKGNVKHQLKSHLLQKEAGSQVNGLGFKGIFTSMVSCRALSLSLIDKYATPLQWEGWGMLGDPLTSQNIYPGRCGHSYPPPHTSPLANKEM